MFGVSTQPGPEAACPVLAAKLEKLTRTYPLLFGLPRNRFMSLVARPDHIIPGFLGTLAASRSVILWPDGAWRDGDAAQLIWIQNKKQFVIRSGENVHFRYNWTGRTTWSEALTESNVSQPVRGMFERLLGQMTEAEFLAKKYEAEPYHCRIEDNSILASLPTLEDIDRILWQAKGELSTFVALFRDNIQLNPSRSNSGSAFRQWLADEFHAGATIVIRRVHDAHHGTAVLARQLGQQCNADITVNAYLSPPNSQGFGVHYDAHNIFVVQLAGEKNWKTHGLADVMYPTKDLVEVLDGRTDLLQPTSHKLEPGHVLYLPRGEIHQASTSDNVSLHLSFGLHPPTVPEILLEMAEVLAERDPMVRKLPYLGSINSALRISLKQLIAALAEAMESDSDILASALTRRARKRVRGMESLFDPEASRFARTPVIGSQSRLLRRQGAECSIREFDEYIDITFPGLGTREHPASLQAPLNYQSALRFIAEVEGSFTPTDLPGDLSMAQRLTLLQSLFRVGLVRVQDAHGEGVA